MSAKVSAKLIHLKYEGSRLHILFQDNALLCVGSTSHYFLFNFFDTFKILPDLFRTKVAKTFRPKKRDLGVVRLLVSVKIAQLQARESKVRFLKPALLLKATAALCCQYSVKCRGAAKNCEITIDLTETFLKKEKASQTFLFPQNLPVAVVPSPVLDVFQSEFCPSVISIDIQVTISATIIRLISCHTFVKLDLDDLSSWQLWGFPFLPFGQQFSLWKITHSAQLTDPLVDDQAMNECPTVKLKLICFQQMICRFEVIFHVLHLCQL